MNIVVVGLGLIGGSFCKAISAKTKHNCFGIDTDLSAIKSAIADKAILREISPSELSDIDLTIVCLHPNAAMKFILDNAKSFKKGSIVIDSCGVKSAVIERVEMALLAEDVYFLGCHPMAGREFSGYPYSLESLFEKASFIITPTENTTADVLETVKDFSKEIGFAKTVVTTALQHDKTIAFTSQLAHIVSSSYIKSPTLKSFDGFSAGSFLDLTRVAKLNEDMWTSLFLLNKEPLIFEISTIIAKLEEYRQVLEDDNSDELKKLLKEGRILKEGINS